MLRRPGVGYLSYPEFAGDLYGCSSTEPRTTDRRTAEERGVTYGKTERSKEIR